MLQPVRVFISSPGDVRDAREIAAQTVEKLAQDYLRYFAVEPYLWENEALVASGHFQDAIEAPSEFDVVALILWSRLGTLLPAKTEMRAYLGIDGRSPVTGTEWEYEDALRAARAHGVPDLLVYRNTRPAPVNVLDPANRQNAIDQMVALDAFWTRHFVDQGAFLSAFRHFEKLEDFATDLERDLRQLLDRRVAASIPGESKRFWPGSPFLGLGSFSFEHAPIFFGRAAETGHAVGRLIENAGDGRAFLLVCGASGSGKSSLACAGILPRLFLPRRVVGKSFQRRIIFRPGNMQEGEDLFDALARAMISSQEMAVGLPELGPGQRLAEVFREAPRQAPAFLEGPLRALTEMGRQSGRLLVHEEAAAVLVVDQLEEIFTDRRITASQRETFVQLLAALAHSGCVWVVATLRADFWHRVSDVSDLIALADGHGRYDLLPPGHAQVGQMIQFGAEAAGLAYEASPEDGIGLGERIAEAAAEAPGVLPLLSYLLEQLYETDAVNAASPILTYATYERLGRLRGSIATRAEAILAEQPSQARDALKAMLFQLVEVSRDSSGSTTLTSRRAPIHEFGQGPVRSLVDAFLAPEARLLVVEMASNGAPVVRVAHEALFREWGRARACVEDDAALIAIRRMVEERFGRWSARRPPAPPLAPWRRRLSMGLLTEVDLADGQRLLAERRAEISHELQDFIDLSGRRQRARRRNSVITACLAATFATCLLIGALGIGYVANRNAAEARDMDRAAADAQRSGDEALRSNDISSAISHYGQSVQDAEKAVQLQPNNAQWRFSLASTQAFLGYVYLKRNAVGDGADSATQFSAAKENLSAAAKLSNVPPDLREAIGTLQGQLSAYSPRM